MEVFKKSDLKPLSSNIEGKLVVIEPKYFKPEFRSAKYQLVRATGGFGCDASKMGNAVFVHELHNSPDREEYRQERYNIIGEPTDEAVEKWKSLYGEFVE